MSKIEWTEKTWNPGHPESLDQPMKRATPTTWLVDIDSVTDEQLDQVFSVMALTPWHTYQILTKRAARMLEYCDRLTTKSGGFALAEAITKIDVQTPHKGLLVESLKSDGGACLPLPNVWLGVSVENQQAADERIPLLLQTPAAVRFLSCEPLLEKVSLDGHLDMFYMGMGEETCISWVIVGGESGSSARPCDIEWIRSIVQQCADANVPCFVKQLGSEPLYPEVDVRWAGMTTGKGNIPEEWPEDLRVRQMPHVNA